MLNNFMSAIPKVLEVVGQHPQDLQQYTMNLLQSQNIPVEQAINQAKGLINLAGGEENVKKILSKAGFKI